MPEAAGEDDVFDIATSAELERPKKAKHKLRSLSVQSPSSMSPKGSVAYLSSCCRDDRTLLGQVGCAFVFTWLDSEPLESQPLPVRSESVTKPLPVASMRSGLATAQLASPPEDDDIFSRSLPLSIPISKFGHRSSHIGPTGHSRGKARPLSSRIAHPRLRVQTTFETLSPRSHDQVTPPPATTTAASEFQFPPTVTDPHTRGLIDSMRKRLSIISPRRSATPPRDPAVHASAQSPPPKSPPTTRAPLSPVVAAFTSAGTSVPLQSPPSTPTRRPRSKLFAFGLQNTSAKAPDVILTQLKRVLRDNSVSFKHSEPYLLLCNVGSVQFEMEVCKVPLLHLTGLRHKRIAGTSFGYKNICSKIFQELQL
eukprot:m.417569 g.417569  ORF g.417569 m.417569 type:complete len:367 (+) comp56620_c0_seq8:1539-2639(+)